MIPERKQILGMDNVTQRCEPFVDANRAGELLKLHPKTVKRMAQLGLLPATKIGRVWRFRESSLDAWMSERIHCSCHPSPHGKGSEI